MGLACDPPDLLLLARETRWNLAENGRFHSYGSTGSCSHKPSVGHESALERVGRSFRGCGSCSQRHIHSVERFQFSTGLRGVFSSGAALEVSTLDTVLRAELTDLTSLSVLQLNCSTIPFVFP